MTAFRAVSTTSLYDGHEDILAEKEDWLPQSACPTLQRESHSSGSTGADSTSIRDDVRRGGGEAPLT